MNQEFFKAYCITVNIDFKLASKIVNGKYKFGKDQYLSAIDDQYYKGNDSWEAKTKALQSAIKQFGKEGTILKLKQKTFKVKKLKK